jgi:hypothetical protein
MANIANDDLFEVIWSYQYQGQTIMFTMHYRIASLVGSPPTLAAAAVAIQNELDALGGISQQLAGCYNDEATGGFITIQKIYPARFLKNGSASTFPDGTEGTYTVAMPPNVSLALTLRSDFAGPHFKGTRHLGCVPNDFIDNGLVTAMGLTAMADLGNQLVASLACTSGGATFSCLPVILNRASPGVSPLITSYIRGSTSRTMRRRGVGLGI